MSTLVYPPTCSCSLRIYSQKTMDISTELIAGYATSLRFEDLPPEVVHDTPSAN